MNYEDIEDIGELNPNCITDEDLYNKYDRNFITSVAYQQSNDSVKEFFSKNTVEIISYKVTELLRGVDPLGRDINVTHANIGEIMSTLYNSKTVKVGDIFSKTRMADLNRNNHFQELIDETIDQIVSDIKTRVEHEEHQKKLTVWTTLLGDFNDHGLRSHSQIKIRNKGPERGQFHMHY
jgi:hypothetical protein